MEMGERIRYLREAKSWTQGDLAEKLGVGVATVSGWEIGTRTPRIDTLGQIAATLGTTASWLMGEDPATEITDAFPEAVALLKRANGELTNDQKKKLVKMMEMLIDSMN